MSQYKFATIQVAMLQYKSMKTLEINANLAEIESRLNRYSYLSRKTLPGSPDGRVFAILESNKRYPDRKINPNFYHWYILMKQFSRPTIGRWVSDQLYHDQEDNLINEFVQFYATKQDSAPEPTAPAASDPRNNKLNDSTQIQYTIDIALKAYHPDKITSLRRLLELYRAEMTEDGSKNSKYIRILCRIGPANLEELSRKLNNCIEFSELSLKRKDMKGQKLSQGRELIQ